ncbi:5025_t:CDS:2, partial [Ambispora leptoticha]
MANRINPICNLLIGSAQQAFIRGRSITNTALDILTVLRNQTDQLKQHWLLLLDQQKAFDRVNHSYLQTVLQKMNFDPKFTRIVNMLFSTQQAHITASAVYADDLTVGFSSTTDWDSFTNTINKYEKASNAK